MNRTPGNKKLLEIAYNTLNPSAQKTLLDIPVEILAMILTHTTKDRFAACQTCRILCSIIHDIIGYHRIWVKTDEQAKQVVKHSGIMKHTKIKFVNNTRTKFPSDEIVKQFAGVHTIGFRLCNCITDEGVKALAGVHTINLCASYVGDEGVKALAGVHTIGLEYLYVTDEGVKALVGVHTIDLKSTCVTDEGVKALAGVHTIKLDDTVVTDEGIKSLVGVHTISLINCVNITVEGIKALKDVHEIAISPPTDLWLKPLGNVHSVTILGGNITDDGIKSLSKVSHLSIFFCPNITDLGFKTLVNLEQLHLQCNNKITDGCLEYLKSLKRVVSGGTLLTKEAVESMGIQYTTW